MSGPLSEDSSYRCFSGPHQEFDEGFFQLLVAQYAATLLGLVLERFGDSEAISEVRESLLEIMGKADQDFEVCWSPGLAMMFTALRSGDPEAASTSVAQFLLQAEACGVMGDWRLRFSRPAVFWWDCFLLPATTSLDVQARRNQVRIKTSSDGTVRFHRRTEFEAWEAEGNTEALAVAREGQLNVPLFCRKAVPQLTGVRPVERTQESHVRPVAEALSLLREKTPRFHRWVARVLRRLVIIEPSDGLLLNGNFGGHRGIFYMSHCEDPLSVAEMLVHECSHQYYHALVQVEEVTDPSHGGMYYSPFVQKKRPLDRILLAYHAFANVHLFYREYLQATGRPHSWTDPNLKTLIEDVDSVEEVLMATDKLTAVGRALADPLHRERRTWMAKSTA